MDCSLLQRCFDVKSVWLMVVPLAMLYQMLTVLYVFTLMPINRNGILLLITLLANCHMTLK